MRNTAFLLFLWAAAAWSQCPATIDDFSTGKYKVKLDSGTDQQFQSGDMFSRVRRTVFIVGQPFTTNPFQQQGAAEMRLAKPGWLIVSSGAKTNWVLEMLYGVGDGGIFRPAKWDTFGCNKFLLKVDSSDTGFYLLMTLYTNNFTTWSSVQVFVPASFTPYTKEIPFSSFSGSANWRQIDFINLGFRSGTGGGSDDFSVRSLTATP